MRFFITGEWNRNRLLQTIIALYALYVAALWLTNALLYFQNMSLTPDSVIAYYLGNEEAITCPAASPLCMKLAPDDYVFEVFPGLAGSVNSYTFQLTITPM